MTDRTRTRTARGPRRPRPAVVLDPPPAYLRDLPVSALLDASPRPSDPLGAAHRIERALSSRGIVARPMLAEVEAERARRGLRRLAVGSAPRRVVLPVLPYGATEAAPVSEEARTNRARVAEALDGLPFGEVQRIGWTVSDERRHEEREAA